MEFIYVAITYVYNGNTFDDDVVSTTIFGLKNAMTFFKKQKGDPDVDYIDLRKGTVDKHGVVTHSHKDSIMEFRRRE